MSDEQTPSFYARKWLNTEAESGIALIEARIGPIQLNNGAGEKYFDAFFKIGDCTRHAELDFSIWGKSPDRVLNLRRKIAMLRRVVEQFEAILLTQLDEVEEG